jgi:hypothetical protein
LFKDLERSKNPAVTPSIELAKLALVTSKDEEEEETSRPATDSSGDTDATLVDEPGQLIPTSQEAGWIDRPQQTDKSLGDGSTHDRMDVDQQVVPLPPTRSHPPPLPPRKKTTHLIPESAMMFGDRLAK